MNVYFFLPLAEAAVREHCSLLSQLPKTENTDCQ